MKNPLVKNFLIVLIIFLVLGGIFGMFSDSFQEKEEISLTKLAEQINQDKVKEVTVSGNNVFIKYKDEKEAISSKETEIALSESLLNYGVTQNTLQKIDIISKEEVDWTLWLWPIMLLLLPFLFFFFIFKNLSKNAKSGAMQALNFSKAKAKLFGAEGHEKEKITFKDIAGLKEVKEELKEVVDFLKNPKKFLKMGARIPRGVLLMGPPGCGKTLLARAVAGEGNVPFFSVSGSEFVEMFVGVGASRVRDLFNTAKKSAPAILFIDELDAVGRHRGTGLGGGHDEREQTLNQILVEMDGFERDTNVIVIAATNRPDTLDPALLRPGRFDRRMVLNLPDINDREAVLKIHSKGKPFSDKINLREIAERTPGFSGADLANLMNEAALLAARKDKKKIFQEDLFQSIDKVLLGPERKSHILSEKEKKITAYHESGHALTATLLPFAEPIRKISIIARGKAAGYTLKLPDKEKYLKTKSEFMSELASLLGGYCAEKIVFGEMSTGASSDLQTASDLARKIVKEYGMSEKFGPISFGDKDEMVFLGKEIGEEKNYSEKTASEIDDEVEKILKKAEKTAIKVLKKERKLLDKLSKRLCEKETIEREEFEKIIGRSKKKK
jgi:cell division protease FtsH